MSSNDNGYVYILMNPSMSGLVKIGKTQREPEERAKELSSTTGVPTPFTVVYDGYFENCSEAEKHIHTLLESKGYRVSQYREFFEIPIKDAIDAVIEAKNYFGEFKNSTTDKNIEEVEYKDPWEDIVEIAESYEYGTGDYIQDFKKAITYYLKAIKLGYKYGYETISWMYMHDLDDKRNALKYLEKGIEDGCISCYATLGFHHSFTDFKKAKKSYELYMKYIPKEDLVSSYTMLDYLHFSIIEISIYDDINEIKYFSKILPYKNMILKDLKTHEFNPLNYEYKSFYDLPSTIKNAVEKKSEEHSYLSYIFSGYEVEYRIEKDAFLDYMELIFNSGYISPDKFEQEICTIELEEIPFEDKVEHFRS